MDDNAKHRIWLSEGQWTIQHPMDCDIDLCAVRALADRDNTMKRLYRIEEQRAAGQPPRRSTRRIHLGKS